jgi:hypothetical protein
MELEPVKPFGEASECKLNLSNSEKTVVRSPNKLENVTLPLYFPKFIIALIENYLSKIKYLILCIITAVLGSSFQVLV